MRDAVAEFLACEDEHGSPPLLDGLAVRGAVVVEPSWRRADSAPERSGEPVTEGCSPVEVRTAAGSFYCKASSKALTAGTYTPRIVRVAGPNENSTLTVCR